MSENPLLKLYRNKNIFISLPSNGKYYPSGIELSVDGELGVYPMTAKDEILLKSPDALFNGNALIDLIKSCVPDIKNPEEMPSCDVDPIMIAIRAASNKNIEVKSICPSCNKEHEYEVDVTRILATTQKIPEDNIVELDNVKIHCRPYTLRSQIKANIQKFNQIRLEMIINKNVEITEEKRLELFNKIIEETTELTFEIVSDNIVKVELGDAVVEEKQYIKEWVENMEKETYFKIIEKVKSISDNNMNNEIEVMCGDCNKPHKIYVDMNPMTFFI